MGKDLVGNLARIKSHDRRRCAAIVKKVIALGTHVTALTMRVVIPAGITAITIVGGIDFLLAAQGVLLPA